MASPCLIPPTKLWSVNCFSNRGKQLSVNTTSDLFDLVINSELWTEIQRSGTELNVYKKSFTSVNWTLSQHFTWQTVKARPNHAVGTVQSVVEECDVHMMTLGILVLVIHFVHFQTFKSTFIQYLTLRSSCCPKCSHMSIMINDYILTWNTTALQTPRAV